ncbi:MAG: D-tyrosyl-tRNA(Tyr) deacylase [Candidatus Omnitrophica bacterium]|nr:D-tyrosyl-tRNA(Tyr) deacylase [Candidatus Omnitrophota bacterium]
MRAVIQRVKQASVTVDNRIVGKIQQGILVLLAVAQNDTLEEAKFLARKISELRIFEDEHDKMNLSVLDVKGSLLVVSQFTLYGDCRKGRRPSFDQSADPQTAEELYEQFVELVKQTGLNVETGQFRARMDVALVNDGPVTFILETK